jgi:hypothetical protein
MQPNICVESDERTFSVLDELIQSLEQGGPQERLRILRDGIEMRDAERRFADDDLRRYAEQYEKLKRETARNILRFREQRLQSNVVPIRPGLVPGMQNEPDQESQRAVSR